MYALDSITIWKFFALIFTSIVTTFEDNICAAQPLLLYLIIVICVLVAVDHHKIA